MTIAAMIPCSPEFVEALTDEWSRPVQVRIEDGEFVFRYALDSQEVVWQSDLAHLTSPDYIEARVVIEHEMPSGPYRMVLVYEGSA